MMQLKKEIIIIILNFNNNNFRKKVIIITTNNTNPLLNFFQKEIKVMISINLPIVKLCSKVFQIKKINIKNNKI